MKKTKSTLRQAGELAIATPFVAIGGVLVGVGGALFVWGTILTYPLWKKNR